MSREICKSPTTTRKMCEAEQHMASRDDIRAGRGLRTTRVVDIVEKGDQPRNQTRVFRCPHIYILVALLFLGLIGCAIPLVIYAVRFGEATSCRLTYTDDAIITESEMQKWMADEKWPLSVPTYDPWRRTCVCKGFEDIDPKRLKPSDEVLVWIAPGDLVSLSDEEKITPRLPPTFVDKYRGKYNQTEHVKVCLRQDLVLHLWNIDWDVSDGGRHCHVSSGDGSSNVEQFFLGWDGALYCTCAANCQTYCDNHYDCHRNYDSAARYSYAGDNGVKACYQANACTLGCSNPSKSFNGDECFNIKVEDADGDAIWCGNTYAVGAFNFGKQKRNTVC